MFLYRQKGSISIFLCIILISVVTLTSLMVDAARIKSSQVSVERATNLAVNSALAGYNKDLKDKWGLFVLYQNDKEKIKEIIKYYLEKNLMIDAVDSNDNANKYINLFDYKIENIDVAAYYSITDVDVAKKQIVEYVKYRVPKEIIEKLVDKLDVLKFASSTSKVYEEKISLEESIDEMCKLRQELYEKIGPDVSKDSSGIGIYKSGYPDNKFFVNQFNKEQYVIEKGLNISDVFVKYRDIIISYQNERIKKAKVNKKIVPLEAEISKKRSKIRIIQRQHSKNQNSDKKTESSAIKDLNAEISNLQSQVNKFEKEIDVIDKNMQEFSKEMKEKYEYIQQSLSKGTGNWLSNLFHENESYKTVVSTSLNITNKLFDKYKEVSKDVEQYEVYVENNKGEIIEDSYRSVRKDIREYKSSIPTDDEIKQEKEQLVGDLENNKNCLNRILNNLEKISPTKINNCIVNDENMTISFSKKEDFNSTIGNGKGDSGILSEIKRYKNSIDIHVKMTKKPVAGSKKKQKEKIKKIAEEANEEINDGKEKNKKDVIVISEGTYLKLPSNNKSKPDDGLDEIYFDEDDNEYSKNAFAFLGQNLLECIEDLRDKLYINEYIIKSFKNNVTHKNLDEKNLRNIKKSNLETFFENGEVEYILNGCKSEKNNEIMTDAKIVMMRFGLNCIHVFSDAQKRTEATAVATAIAGWWTGGAGVPIFRTIIQCAWSMGESIEDLRCLKRGESVELLKNAATWKTSSAKIFMSETIEEVFSQTTDVLNDMTDYYVDTSMDFAEEYIDEKINEIKNGEMVSFNFDNVDNEYLRELLKEVQSKIDAKVKSDIANYSDAQIIKWKDDIRKYVNSKKDEIKKHMNKQMEKIKDSSKEKLEDYSKKFKEENSVTKIDLSKGTNKKIETKSNMLKADYTDYLRFLLLLQSEEKSVLRTLDLIQLNSMKKGNDILLNQCNVCVKVKVEVSIKNLLFAKKLLQDNVEKGNRSIIKVEFSNWY